MPVGSCSLRHRNGLGSGFGGIFHGIAKTLFRVGLVTHGRSERAQYDTASNPQIPFVVCTRASYPRSFQDLLHHPKHCTSTTAAFQANRPPLLLVPGANTFLGDLEDMAHGMHCPCQPTALSCLLLRKDSCDAELQTQPGSIISNLEVDPSPTVAVAVPQAGQTQLTSLKKSRS